MGIYSLWNLWWIIDIKTRFFPSPSVLPDCQIFTAITKFKYLGFESSYENDKDIQQRETKFTLIPGNLKSTFKMKFGPEIFKYKV